MSFLKRNKNGGLWVIFFYCIVSFFTDLTFSSLKTRINPFYIYGSFTILEYTLFALFFYSSFSEKILKYILILGSLIFYIMAILNFSGRKTENFDSLTASLESILIIVYCIFFLYEQIKDPAVFYIYYSKKFWIIIAFLIYFSSTLFLFLYAATFTKQEHSNYWSINNIFNILKNAFFTISFAMKKSKKPQYSMDNLYGEL
ncbi:hypothetical protein ACX0G9_14390 [Flavitalea flava]